MEQALAAMNHGNPVRLLMSLDIMPTVEMRSDNCDFSPQRGSLVEGLD
jgi:hypothetical protein